MRADDLSQMKIIKGVLGVEGDRMTFSSLVRIIAWAIMDIYGICVCYGGENPTNRDPVIFTTETVNNAIESTIGNKSYFSYGSSLHIQVLRDNRVVIQSGLREKAFVFGLDGSITMLTKPTTGIVLFSSLLEPVVMLKDGSITVKGNTFESARRFLTCFDASEKYFTLQLQGGRGTDLESTYWVMSVDGSVPVISGNGWIYYVRSDDDRIESVVGHYKERVYIVSTRVLGESSDISENRIVVKWPESIRPGRNFIFKDYDVRTGKLLFLEGSYPRSILQSEVIWEYDLESSTFKQYKVSRFGAGRGNIYALASRGDIGWEAILRNNKGAKGSR